jgi:hypothetical protein
MWIRTLVAQTLLATLLACGSPEAPFLGVLEDPLAPFSRIRYSERDQVSLNDRCPITGTQLNPAIPPVYVNGRPIGFC